MPHALFGAYLHYQIICYSSKFNWTFCILFANGLPPSHQGQGVSAFPYPLTGVSWWIWLISLQHSSATFDWKDNGACGFHLAVAPWAPELRVLFPSFSLEQDCSGEVAVKSLCPAAHCAPLYHCLHKPDWLAHLDPASLIVNKKNIMNGMWHHRKEGPYPPWRTGHPCLICSRKWFDNYMLPITACCVRAGAGGSSLGIWPWRF